MTTNKPTAKQKQDAFYYECISYVLEGDFHSLIKHVAKNGKKMVELQKEIRNSNATRTRSLSLKEKNSAKIKQIATKYAHHGRPSAKDKDRIERVVLQDGTATPSEKKHNAKRNAGKTKKIEKLYYRGLHAYNIGEQDVAEIFLDRLAEVHGITYDIDVKNKPVSEMTETELKDRLADLKDGWEAVQNHKGN